ncbi:MULTISPECIES: sporulation histidine kinase inhibitor Sda [Shouchella]|uniref:Sporulation inhibitor n=2 Tax=Shouchella lehensis TaxID=300825 RepID=A0A060LWX4_9BACI|nr:MULTISPECIES: sporulation histidine kinase inhibitor Sda [Bacillaceae]AIC94692.1 sporulation inhibitor [Shouchella lehensis G1]RQW20553.1 sporulation histidine kinase inhibitor Sda [Bacillus sp. C1-1]TES50566.1 sporulation histidine kinase inhibitor Sda [Shouchella lehensis]
MLQQLNDQLLIEACELAEERNLNRDFVDILKEELERRGLGVSS